MSALPQADGHDYEAIKTRQKAAWAAGDYAIVGTTLQIVGERLCETLDLRAGSRVLDVAAGNGNATLAAARRWCDVVSTDYVDSLLARGRERAEAERLPIRFEVADAEALPYAPNSFDVGLSTFGVMFAPNHPLAAGELIRVVRSGGFVGLANWTPESFIGALFRTLGDFVPPPPGVKSPALWGTEDYLHELFGAKARSIEVLPRVYNFRYMSVGHWVELFRTYYGPVHKAFAALSESDQDRLAARLNALGTEHNVATDGTMVVPADYVEVVVEKR
ncbi:MAG: class I SAM-dependent methyltransferase [Pseudomonadota bacterium]